MKKKYSNKDKVRKVIRSTKKKKKEKVYGCHT